MSFRSLRAEVSLNDLSLILGELGWEVPDDQAAAFPLLSDVVLTVLLANSDPFSEGLCLAHEQERNVVLLAKGLYKFFIIVLITVLSQHAKFGLLGLDRLADFVDTLG